MVNQVQDRILNEVMEALTENGTDGFAQALTLILNTSMELEREKHIGAKAYERTDTRVAQSNGFKDKSTSLTAPP